MKRSEYEDTVIALKIDIHFLFFSSHFPWLKKKNGKKLETTFVWRWSVPKLLLKVTRKKMITTMCKWCIVKNKWGVIIKKYIYEYREKFLKYSELK